MPHPALRQPGRRAAGSPAGGGGEARCPPRLTQMGSSSVPAAEVCPCGKVCVQGLSEAPGVRRGRGANRLGARAAAGLG